MYYFLPLWIHTTQPNINLSRLRIFPWKQSKYYFLFLAIVFWKQKQKILKILKIIYILKYIIIYVKNIVSFNYSIFSLSVHWGHRSLFLNAKKWALIKGGTKCPVSKWVMRIEENTVPTTVYICLIFFFLIFWYWNVGTTELFLKPIETLKLFGGNPGL